MKHFRMLLVLFALAAPPLAHAEEKAPDKKEEMSPADVARAKKFFNAFADAIIKNQSACPKMAVAMNAVLDKHEAWLAKMAESKKDMPQAAKDEVKQKQQDMMSAVFKCKDDKGVLAAMQRLGAIASKKKGDEPAPPPPPPPAKN